MESSAVFQHARRADGARKCAHRIVREEGVGGLFTGAGPTVVRAMALNMGMLASNDQVGCTALTLHCWPALNGTVTGRYSPER